MKRLIPITITLFFIAVNVNASCIPDYRREYLSKSSNQTMESDELSELISTADEYHMKKVSSRRRNTDHRVKPSFFSAKKSRIKAFMVINEAYIGSGSSLTEFTKDVDENIGFNKSEATVLAYVIALDEMRAFCGEELATYEDLVYMTAEQI